MIFPVSGNYVASLQAAVDPIRYAVLLEMSVQTHSLTACSSQNVACLLSENLVYTRAMDNVEKAHKDNYFHFNVGQPEANWTYVDLPLL